MLLKLDTGLENGVGELVKRVGDSLKKVKVGPTSIGLDLGVEA